VGAPSRSATVGQNGIVQQTGESSILCPETPSYKSDAPGTHQQRAPDAELAKDEGGA
jgi:hypothetical protein